MTVYTLQHTSVISIVPTLMALILTFFLLSSLPLTPIVHSLDQFIRTRIITTADDSIPQGTKFEILDAKPTRRKEVQTQEVASPRKRIKRKYAGMSSKSVRPNSQVTRLLEEDPTFKMISNTRIFREAPEKRHEVLTNNIRKKIRMKNKRTRHPAERRKSRTLLRQFDIVKNVGNISEVYSCDDMAKPSTQTRDGRKDDEEEDTIQWNINKDISYEEEEKHNTEDRDDPVMSVITLLD